MVKEMKFNIIEQIDPNMKEDEINIIIKSKKETEDVKRIIHYINNYNDDKINAIKNYKNILIDYKDIWLFYGENKNNYCKTKDGIYRIKRKLYELETRKDFIRISKKCLVNINYVKCFDTSQTGKIIVRFYDETEEYVSRRKIKNVLAYLEDRSI